MNSTAPTIHNPTNFDPAHYEIVDYFDNKPPEYHFGMTIEHFTEMREAWNRDLLALFPDRRAHKCVHCGNGNVRYVVCARHVPTATNVCFGADCAHKLSFANKSELKLAQLKARAELNTARLKVYAAYQRYVAAHPEVLEYEKALSLPVHAGNSFARDVLSKLREYGSLSDRQLECIASSLKRDVDFAARKAADAEKMKDAPLAPEGRVTVEGEIVSVRSIPGYTHYSPCTFKILLKLDDGNKAWVSLPSASDAGKGQRIKLTATFERSKDDTHFCFGKRPKLVESPAEVAARTVIETDLNDVSRRADDFGAAMERHADEIAIETGQG
jgi:hypothetical protein